MQQLLKNTITHLGLFKSMVVLFLSLILLVLLTTGLVSCLIFSEILASNIILPIIVTSITAPYILYTFVRLIIQLKASEEKQRELSIMDDLTGVYNRRFFIEQAEKELARAKRYGSTFSIILLDIDNFKHINDSYGHFGGDAVIKALASTCMENLRATEIFARYGGEEFAFLIPDSDKSNVRLFSERIREALEATSVNYYHDVIQFTASLGINTFDAQASTLEMMLKAADAALYQAKRTGKNRVVVY